MDEGADVEGWGDLAPPTRRRISAVYAGFALSAYAPMALMLSAIYLSKSLILSAVWCAVAIFLASSVALLIGGRARSTGARTIRFTNRQDQGDAVAGYLATFIIPFLVVPTSSVGVGVAYLIFFLIALFLQTRSRLGLINPTLYILGWRVSRIETAEGSVFLVHRSNVPPEGQIRAVAFSGIFIEKQKRTA